MSEDLKQQISQWIGRDYIDGTTRRLFEAALDEIEALRKSRAEIIRECAAVCDEKMQEFDRDHANGHSSGAYWCGQALRDLANKEGA